MKSIEETDIHDRLVTARAQDDTEGIVRGLRDLESIGWKQVCLVTRCIGINGERLEVQMFLNGGLRIIAPMTTGAFKLIWSLRFRMMFKRGHYRYVKHFNDMAPEEYEWVTEE